MSKYSRRKRDRAYMAWIKTLPCANCTMSYRVEVAHVGPRALSHKCSDRETIPLCAACHREGKDSLHQLGKKFWRAFRLNRTTLIRKYNRLYEELHEKTSGEAAKGGRKL